MPRSADTDRFVASARLLHPDVRWSSSRQGDRAITTRNKVVLFGVVFMGTDQALIEYPETFRKHFTVLLEPGKFCT